MSMTPTGLGRISGPALVGTVGDVPFSGTGEHGTSLGGQR